MVNQPSRSSAIDRSTALPWGTQDLDPEVVRTADRPVKVRCVIRGCRQQLRVPTRGDKGQVCPVHGIRVHASGAATYSYRDPRRNIIVAPDLFTAGILHNPFKYESHRFGLEKSEDALTWNVFVSLQQAGQLGAWARHITGDESQHEPFLYLWGLGIEAGDCEPWPLLVAARERFETNLPVDRPLTEPDIGIFLPGRYLILIEAKFTSANTYYQMGPRKDGRSLTLNELRQRYWDDKLTILDREAALDAPRVFQQLWRNTVFAEWMARHDHPRTRAFHVNLVRQGCETESAAEFNRLVRTGFQDRFQQHTWEALYSRCGEVEQLALLERYFEQKTAGLRPAFTL